MEFRIVAVLCRGLLVAGLLFTGSCFAQSGIALTGQINDEGNRKVVGWLLDYGNEDWVETYFTPDGYVFRLDKRNSSLPIKNSGLFWKSTDCTGTPFHPFSMTGYFEMRGSLASLQRSAGLGPENYVIYIGLRPSYLGLQTFHSRIGLSSDGVTSECYELERNEIAVPVTLVNPTDYGFSWDEENDWWYVRNPQWEPRDETSDIVSCSGFESCLTP
jgi:hypothetical protein